MIVRFSPRPEDLQRLQIGPIGPHLPSFATLVSQQGYCSVTGWLKVRLVAKLSRWLLQHRVPLNELNETHIAPLRYGYLRFFVICFRVSVLLR